MRQAAIKRRREAADVRKGRGSRSRGPALPRMPAVLPTSKTPRNAAPEARPGQIPVAAVAASKPSPEALDPQGTGPRDPLEPIGPERLRALREAIQNGTYPLDEHVMGGLGKLFGRE